MTVGRIEPAFAARVVRAALLCSALACASAASSQPAEPGAEDPESVRTTLPPAEFDEELAIGGEEIDADMLASRMTVEVRVNDTGPYRFIVDSGADTSVVGQRIAAALAMPAAEPRILNAMTETTWVERVTVDSLQLGPATFEGLKVPVLRERHIGAEGMIGLDALVDQRLMMDFENRTITVDGTDDPEPEWGGEIVVRARLQRGQLILTEVEAGRHAVEAVIDTGTEISIGNAALKDLLFRRTRSRDRLTVGIAGVTGKPADLEVVIVRELQLGPVKVYNVPIAFADVPPFRVFGLDETPALLLGTDLMEHFRKVSLDFGARKVRFQLKKCERQRIELRAHTSFASRVKAERARIEARTISACAR